MPEERLVSEAESDSTLDAEARQAAQSRADAWHSRLQPLFRDDGPLDLADIHASLGLLRELRSAGPDVQSGVSFDAARRVGLSEGMVRLDQLERKLRERLTDLDPSDPDALADTPERAARAREAVSRRDGEERLRRLASTPLDEVLCKPDAAQAVATGGFALFWNLFTLFHAAVMLTSFWHAFGPVALLGLAFYAIFFGVGFFVGRQALDALKAETLRLDGDLLVLSTKVGPFGITRNVVLSDGARFQLVKAHRNGKQGRELAIRSATGEEIRFGGRVPEGQKESLVKRLNERRTVVRARF